MYLFKNCLQTIEPAGNTRTGKAIRFMSEVAFNEANGARAIENGYNRVAIVLTDGRSQDNVFQPAEDALNSGIVVIAVGVSFVFGEFLIF